MAIDKIDSKTLKSMFIAGAKYLESKKKYVDELNVFPVPDGDTGTNMTLTILAAAKEVANADANDMAKVAKAISSGSLRGARGNSGVILSQLFRGFAKEISEYSELDTVILANAMAKGVETAYKAVMKPKEGTILTVAKAAAEKASLMAVETEDLIYAFGEVIKYAQEVLEKTPDMLPVLKQAGVVDAGGQGLVYVLQGAYDALKDGLEVTLDTEMKAPEAKEASKGISPQQMAAHSSEDIHFAYCTEFIISVKAGVDSEEKALELRDFLETIGDSIVAVGDDDVIKIHVHTNDPGIAMQKAISVGELINIKIENMRQQHSSIIHDEHVDKASEVKADNSNVSNVAEVATTVEVTKQEPVIAESIPIEVETVVQEAIPEIVEEIKTIATPVAEVIESQPIIEAPVGTKEVGFVVISIGSGLTSIFRALGADAIVEGGQTMNPSTEDVLNAIESVDAHTVVVLPNNKNIILAAQQAKELIEDKEIIVIGSRSVPQGIAAMISYDYSASPTDNIANLEEAISNVKTGQLTFAVRDTSIDNMTIHEGDILGIGDDRILAVEKRIDDAAKKLLEKLIDSDSELVTIYYGEDVEEETALELLAHVEENYPDCEVEIQYGGQPLYYYILSVE